VSHHCAGCSTTAGMAGCPEHGGHSWSSSQVVVTHCQHGLDLRIHPRCYLCEPAATPAPLAVLVAAKAVVDWAEMAEGGNVAAEDAMFDRLRAALNAQEADHE